MHPSLAVLIGLLFSAILVTASSDESTRAYLLVEKHLETKYLVVGQEATLFYYIYNIGNEVATEIHLHDKSLTRDYFTSKERRISQATFDAIAPGANLTHRVTVTPYRRLMWQDRPAIIRYTDSQSQKTVYSATLGDVPILSEQEHHLYFKDHSWQWIQFLLLTLGPIGVPVLWYFKREKEWQTVVTDVKNK